MRASDVAYQRLQRLPPYAPPSKNECNTCCPVPSFNWFHLKRESDMTLARSINDAAPKPLIVHLLKV